ncbi:bifunctional adenosylcobinamide kinase/adenosylcobinamide-phosphate guanylyltransferase [Desulfotomaculum sp. 1211_IL3151]|uniref:bifunctional adenosylcobinamide kinase/adenosylcobinamide-phosphate guanylyltransferase n=1 Tax=Desulfotomaculum sp. 1211_IL3151 TaxID=3084055 RepID=UPI002FD9A3B7
MIALVTGGTRSGKSAFAEKYAAYLGSSGIYIATSHAYDKEMEQRIQLHRNRRRDSEFSWTTVEEPYELAATLLRLGAEAAVQAGNKVILVDCLTIWLTNWLLLAEKEAEVSKVSSQIDALVNAVADFSGHLLLVGNEVGSGIVPAYPLGREFRDLAGWLNQRLAQVCGQVFLVTAGIPLELKSLEFKLPISR